MEGDFRRPAHGPDGFSAGRPRPQPSHRPRPHLTDLRPAAPAHHTHSQHSHAHQLPALHQTVALPRQAAPRPEPPATTAELIARHERESKQQTGSRRNLVLAGAGLLLVIIVAIIFASHGHAKKSSGPFPAAITPAQITIPVYYPKGLASGYKVSGYKVVKQDILNYTVTSPNNDNFYVDIQAIPPNYDFGAFNKRFSNPVTYQTPIGTATAGLMNNQLICSIKTAKSWVLIDSTAVKALTDMKAIAEALKPSSL